MDIVVIVLLVLLGVIVLTKGKPLWSWMKEKWSWMKEKWSWMKAFVKQLWDSLPPSGFSKEDESWKLGDYFMASFWIIMWCYIIWWGFFR